MARRSSWQSELNDVLSEYVEKERKLSQEIFVDVAEETKEMVSELSPKESGDYSSGWEVIADSKRTFGGFAVDWKYIVGNPKHYQLTHLLERGHQSYNQFGGSYRRVAARKHIKPAEVFGVTELTTRLRNEL